MPKKSDVITALAETLEKASSVKQEPVGDDSIIDDS